MKQFLHININGYLIWGKGGKLRTCLNVCGRHFSAFRPGQHNESNRKDVLNKLIVDLKSQENIYFGKRSSSSGIREKNFLMNFNVQIFPEFLKSLRNLYYFIFVMKSLDQSFTLMKFNECTVTALEVVTFLLSQLRFSELEGLLTQRCREEIENNLKTWPKQQVSALAVLPQRTIRCAPLDIFVSSDVENKKTLVEITCAHYVWLKYSPEFDDDANHMSLATMFMADYPRLAQNFESGIYESDKSVSNFKTLHMAAVFNSKFFREFSSGVDDQWTINAINSCEERRIKLKDAELEALLDQDVCQTQEELAETQQAISNLLRAVDIMKENIGQQQKLSVIHTLLDRHLLYQMLKVNIGSIAYLVVQEPKPRDINVCFLMCTQLLQQQNQKDFVIQ